MKPLRCIHLNTDFALGGVTKSLGLFEHPILQIHAKSRVVPVNMAVVPAPKLDADVVINHATPNWASLPFVCLLRLRNRASWMVHIEHSYTRAWEAANVAEKGRFRTMLKLAYANFDEIVAVSVAQRDWMVEAGVALANKIRVIHPWSGGDALASVPPPEFCPHRPLRLGAMGRFDPAKGFDTLIRAMQLLSPMDAELVIGGFGPGQAELHHLARGCSHIRFAGRITDSADFYAQCDAIIVPSRYEAFGLVAAEAKQAGRPVLVADTDGLPEQVEGCGLVADCSDPAKLAEAIARFTTAPLEHMGKAARRSMAGAQAERLKGWAQLFSDARAKLAAGPTPPSEAEFDERLA
ncbi:glycosyltransferase family 4 protein [Erythrobacter sp. EC-HK427]|uniref:glycosyltransferase family 4 protein n=1 Tax=Erythrobacter sp. EC-HK427 TaxID=2038396 RepID=UPI001252597A|nr:glycosyltransferase family 4 protein [Erythrobacter sp. EC-HK427]VVT04347.1 conserved hypothetical protein [Erythrobacter sp. EC-HK427]